MRSPTSSGHSEPVPIRKPPAIFITTWLSPTLRREITPQPRPASKRQWGGDITRPASFASNFMAGYEIEDRQTDKANAVSPSPDSGDQLGDSSPVRKILTSSTSFEFTRVSRIVRVVHTHILSNTHYFEYCSCI